MNQFQVTNNENEKAFGRAMGLTEERSEVITNHLVEVVVAARDNGLSLGGTLESATAIAKNVNEVAYISFALGGRFESLRNPLHSFLNVLSSK